MLKKAPSKGLSIFGLWTHRIVGFSNADWAGSSLIDGLPQAIERSLKEILCHEKARSRLWCHNLVQSQSIKRW